MIKILFICHGNICRSPMAEFIMKDLVRRKGLADRFRIASAATSTEEIWNGVGNPIYPPAKAEMRRHGIPFDENKRARLLVPADYDRFDLLIGMDERNRRSMRRLFPNDPEAKINLLLDYTDKPREISDPWYTGDFPGVFREIEEGCRALLGTLTEETERTQRADD